MKPTGYSIILELQPKPRFKHVTHYLRQYYLTRPSQNAKKKEHHPSQNLSTLNFSFHLPYLPNPQDTLDHFYHPVKLPLTLTLILTLNPTKKSPLLLLPSCLHLHLQAVQQFLSPFLAALLFLPSAKRRILKRSLKRESRFLRFSLVFDIILFATTCCRRLTILPQPSQCLQLSHLSQRRSLRLHPNLARAPSPAFQPSLLPHTLLLRPSAGLRQPPPEPRRPTRPLCLVKLRQSRKLPRRGNVHPTRKLSFSSVFTNLHHAVATNVPSSFSHHVQRKAWAAQDYCEEGATFIARSARCLQTQAKETGLVFKYFPKPDCHVVEAVCALDSKRERRFGHG